MNSTDLTPSRTTSNRRVHRRFETSLLVRFTSAMLDFDGLAELEAATVENLSRDGLFIRSEFLEVPGTPVMLILTLPSGTTVRLNGSVAWVTDESVRGPGMGIHLRGGLDDGILDTLMDQGAVSEQQRNPRLG